VRNQDVSQLHIRHRVLTPAGALLTPGHVLPEGPQRPKLQQWLPYLLLRLQQFLALLFKQWEAPLSARHPRPALLIQNQSASAQKLVVSLVGFAERSVPSSFPFFLELFRLSRSRNAHCADGQSTRRMGAPTSSAHKKGNNPSLNYAML
jgi:hypothetical protein